MKETGDKFFLTKEDIENTDIELLKIMSEQKSLVMDKESAELLKLKATTQEYKESYKKFIDKQQEKLNKKSKKKYPTNYTKPKNKNR